MIHDKTALQIMDYLDGTLSTEERQAFEEQLEQDTALRQHVEALQMLLTQMERVPEQQPSPMLNERFVTFLQAEKSLTQSPGWRGRIFPFHAFSGIELQAAAAVALLLVGLGFGWFWKVNQRQQAELMALRQEVQSTQKMLVLAMLEKPSASERIQAVNVLEQQAKADPKVIKALIQTLNFDDMVNVRMKAAQALGSFADDQVARDALINSLTTQDSPEVQITIIEILVALKDQKAVPSLRSISKDEAIMDLVRQQARAGLEILL